MEPLQRVSPIIWSGQGRGPSCGRVIPEEVPIAITYDHNTYAVMMATPADLADFAIGFSLTEEVIGHPSDIEELEVLSHSEGVELRMRLALGRGEVLIGRRRRLAGPTGCGLCGIDSLREAIRPARQVGAGRCFTSGEIYRALAALPPAQLLNRQTKAVHAAAFWEPEAGLIAGREDVGRHNALDKLVGALACMERPSAQGLLLLSSRLSIEMVQKAAVMGAPVIVAVSAPTALALRVAEAAEITVIAVAREDGFEVFTYPHRVIA
ncbi:MAG: formate dehydrogenase accessory sulfurtransferase FdhD [Acetobacteraceae bacterium]|nr:formate dehydrogenase accessory sulfurtransferase FdhD [Acetobacteraceae bacterium]